jgi:hypothetical protein
MYNVRQPVLASVLLVVTTLAGTPGSAAPVSPGHPAEWTPHDLIVSFEHLPRIYTCTDLWYKFRDVLRAIGARPDMRILVYQCGPKLGPPAYSPKAQLHFFIPQALQPSQVRWADVNAEPRTIRLEPGHPASIKSSDCELLRQMKDGLFGALPDRVIDFNLACEAPATRRAFSVSVEALTPVDGQARVATTDAAASKPY